MLDLHAIGTGGMKLGEEMRQKERLLLRGWCQQRRSVLQMFRHVEVRLVRNGLNLSAGTPESLAFTELHPCSRGSGCPITQHGLDPPATSSLAAESWSFVSF